MADLVAPPARDDRIEDIYRSQMARLRLAIAASVTATTAALAWDGISADEAASQAAASVGPILTTAGVTAASVSTAYIVRLLTLGDDALPVGEVGLPVDSPSWWADQFATIGGNHESVIPKVTDSQITAAASDAVTQATPEDRVRGWLRRPQSTTCGFCVTAATRPIYRTPIKPVHPGCDCTLRPWLDGEDIGPLVGPYSQIYNRDIASGLDRGAADRGLKGAERSKRHRSRMSNTSFDI